MWNNLKMPLMVAFLTSAISCEEKSKSTTEEISKIWNKKLSCTNETFWQNTKLIETRDSIRIEVVSVFRSIKEKNKLIKIFGTGCDRAVIEKNPYLMRSVDWKKDFSFDEESRVNFSNALIYNCGTMGSYGSYLVCLFDANNNFFEAVVIVTS